MHTQNDSQYLNFAIDAFLKINIGSTSFNVAVIRVSWS